VRIRWNHTTSGAFGESDSCMFEVVDFGTHACWYVTPKLFGYSRPPVDLGRADSVGAAMEAASKSKA
jgi:hypothetical protein